MDTTSNNTPIADGWYKAHPCYAAVNEKDADNYAIRIGWKATATAPRNGDPEPMPDDIEAVFENMVLVYGPNGQIYDMDARNFRAATVADTQAALKHAAELFPAWSQFCATTKDNEERLAWFVEHFDDFEACEVLMKVTHTTRNGKRYTNGRIYSPNGTQKEPRTVDRAALAAKFGKAAKAALKGLDFGTAAAAPAETPNAPVSAPSATPTPTPPAPARAPVPPPATPTSESVPEATVDAAFAEWVKMHPLDSSGAEFYAYAEKLLGRADFENWKAAEWQQVIDDLMPF